MEIATVSIDFNGKTVPFKYRSDSPGDKGVIQQIFQNADYNFQHWAQGQRLMAYHKEQSLSRPSLIIDAGANIGASAVYFLNLFDNAFVFSIEPEVNNWRLLEMNTAAYPNKANFNGAIANYDGELFLQDPGMSDWGFRTSAANTGGALGAVETISPSTILSDPGLAQATPLILKIDIEGGEAALFEGDVAWMDKFALIIIELHDWMLPFGGTSKNFLKAVANYNFDFVHRGENIFLFNRDILDREPS